jgi:hypothetical protein
MSIEHLQIQTKINIKMINTNKNKVLETNEVCNTNKICTKRQITANDIQLIWILYLRLHQ